VTEELMENSGVAIDREISAARGGVKGAVYEDMLNGLDR
jgi:hypothetical protein